MFSNNFADYDFSDDEYLNSDILNDKIIKFYNVDNLKIVIDKTNETFNLIKNEFRNNCYLLSDKIELWYNDKQGISINCIRFNPYFNGDELNSYEISLIEKDTESNKSKFIFDDKIGYVTVKIFKTIDELFKEIENLSNILE